MGVYVSNMQMPKCCNDCPMHRYEGMGEEACTVLGKLAENEELKPWKKRRKDCPLLNVPAPHGPLVDRNDLLNNMGPSFFEKLTPVLIPSESTKYTVTTHEHLIKDFDGANDLMEYIIKAFTDEVEY